MCINCVCKACSSFDEGWMKVGEENQHVGDVIITIYGLVPDYVVGWPLAAERKKSTLGVAY